MRISTSKPKSTTKSPIAKDANDQHMNMKIEDHDDEEHALQAQEAYVV